MSSADIQVEQDGSVTGIDGFLNQVSGSLSSQLIPQFKAEILPILLQDHKMQRTVGQGIGDSIAGPLWALAGVAGVYVAWRIIKNK